jgi:hypothetical protein
MWLQVSDCANNCFYATELWFHEVTIMIGRESGIFPLCDCFRPKKENIISLDQNLNYGLDVDLNNLLYHNIKDLSIRINSWKFKYSLYFYHLWDIAIHMIYFG